MENWPAVGNFVFPSLTERLTRKGLVRYDALLPTVGTPEIRNRSGEIKMYNIDIDKIEDGDLQDALRSLSREA